MGENLVIVESPHKAKTIEKFLGNEHYTVKSSKGHIRDLSPKETSIDILNGFAPKYEIPAEKRSLVAELKAEAKKATTVWLASDEDREGEAIAWHLSETLGLDPTTTKRIVFHEITKDAILKAIENPRTIDMNLVMAQQARRVLDRLVGFELSPVLWKKVQRGLSAGRVQSVALRLIVDREREISAFSSQHYYKVEGIFISEDSGSSIKATLDRRFESEEEALSFLEKCRNTDFIVSDIESKKGVRTPSAPFTTSVLQQEAVRKLGFSVNQTMSIAQKLYEAGLITYMRTDSTNLSTLATSTAKKTVTDLFGKEYSKTRAYHTKAKGAQEAHEAIRPTFIANTEIEGTAAEKRLYDLIWKRTVACQMADAQIEKTVVTISGSNLTERFIAEGEKVLFDGFLKVYSEGRDDEENEGTSSIPASIAVSDNLSYREITATERFSQHPPRYSEASLVKKMEELGIGRPSTYAPTITTIINRGYISRGDKPGSKRDYQIMKLENNAVTRTVKTETIGSEKKKLLPENIGMVVTDFLSAKFADILDYGFTAKVEEDFDKIAAGKKVWNKVIADFYTPFHKEIEGGLQDTVTPVNAIRNLGVDPKTGKVIIARMGKFGPLIQRGDNNDPDKQFVSMKKGQLIESITLDEALQLLTLPRQVGTFEGFAITAAIGRFGPYIKYDSKFVSLGKNISPYEVTEEEAVALIKENIAKKANELISEFEASGIKVLNGRFGPYIKQGKNNYKIPKDTDANTLTEQECLLIIQNAGTTPKVRKKVAKKS